MLNSKSGFDSRHVSRRPGGNKCRCVQASILDTKPVQFRQLHVRKHIKRTDIRGRQFSLARWGQ